MHIAPPGPTPSALANRAAPVIQF